MMNEAQLKMERERLSQQAQSLTAQRDNLVGNLEQVKKLLAQTAGAIQMLDQILASQPEPSAPETNAEEAQTKGEQK